MPTVSLSSNLWLQTPINSQCIHSLSQSSSPFLSVYCRPGQTLIYTGALLCRGSKGWEDWFWYVPECTKYCWSLRPGGWSREGEAGGREGVETLTASLQDIRILLMPSDTTGIYSSRGEPTRMPVAWTVPKFHLQKETKKLWSSKTVWRTLLVSLKDTKEFWIQH